MIEWEPVTPRTIGRALRREPAEVNLTVYRARGGRRLSGCISFSPASVHPFSGPFAAPRPVAVSRSADGSRFLIDATADGPFRVVHTGKHKALCVFFPWRWEPPAGVLVLVPEAVGPGVVQYQVRYPSSSRAYVPPPVSALSSPSVPDAAAREAVLCPPPPLVRMIDGAALPAGAPISFPPEPVVASRDAIAGWASQRGLPHSPFVLEQVNKKRRDLGLAPFALPEKARR